MGVMKTTALMVAVSLGLLLGLGFADPGNTRLMSSFFSNAPRPGVLATGAFDEAGIIRAIAEFNRRLSAAYLELDPAALGDYPMDEGLRRDYAAEIAFLKQDGRALEMTVRHIRIERVRRLPSSMLSVDTVESVKVRYLNTADRAQIADHPAATYAMNYTLEKSAAGWKIAGVETMRAGKRDE